MPKFALIGLCLFLSICCFSQESLPIENKARPLFQFKNGIGLVTPDSSFSVNFRFRIQSRLLMNTVSDENLEPESWEARVRRLRLRLTGHLYSQKLTYSIQLSFSRGDMDWNGLDPSVVNSSPNILRDAMIFYRPNQHWQFGFGQGKLPGNRQRVISSGSLQFYDRSPVNAIFTLDRDFGIFANYSLKKGAFKTILKGAVSSGEGRNAIASNTGLAYTGRLELLPFGEFREGGDYFEGDLLREQHPKLSLGAGFHLNDLAVRTQGQLGRDLFHPVSYQVLLIDFLLKYRGWALSSEYINRTTEHSPITTDGLGSTRFVPTGEGINTQLSYCFPSKWEVAARYSLVTPQEALFDLFNQTEEIGFGITRYLMRHKVKAQFNVFYHHEKNLAQSTDTDRHFFAVFQVEAGI